jgi:hypothetical protein
VYEKEPHPQLRHHTVKDATELRLGYLKGRATHKKNDHFVVAILVSHIVKTILFRVFSAAVSFPWSVPACVLCPRG